MQKDDNPFIVTGHIQPQYFCDRQAESGRLIKLLRNGNNVVLKSDRRMGKTGLIQYCFDKPELSKEYYTFFIDILLIWPFFSAGGIHGVCIQRRRQTWPAA